MKAFEFIEFFEFAFIKILFKRHRSLAESSASTNYKSHFIKFYVTHLSKSLIKDFAFNRIIISKSQQNCFFMRIIMSRQNSLLRETKAWRSLQSINAEMKAITKHFPCAPCESSMRLKIEKIERECLEKENSRESRKRVE